MRDFRSFILCLVFALLTACDTAGADESGAWKYTSHAVPLDDVPAERLARLTKGINTSHWFAQTQLTSQRFTSYITHEDIVLIREMGFRHIRLSLDPDVLFVPSQPDVLNQRYVGLLDDAIAMILDEGLAVIVDLHPKSEFKEQLESDGAFGELVATFWNALAYRLSSFSADDLFLEIMNEPEFEDAAHWARVQGRIADAIRAGAPEHTIIATGPRWSAPEELVRIQPLDDPNVVYNFHFYTPHNFTHQGATWGWYAWEYFHDLPYPSSPEAVEPVVDEIDESVREIVRNYGTESWNRERLGEDLSQVVDWANRHDVPVTCNEFGVYRTYAPPEARLRWLRDARELFEEHGIGWAMWDYAGGFSLVRTDGTTRVPDAPTVEALGLDRDHID